MKVREMVKKLHEASLHQCGILSMEVLILVP